MEFLPRPEDLLPLLPGGLAAALMLLVAGAIHRRESSRKWIGYLLAGLAGAAGHLTTWWMTHDSLPWPPNASSERMIYAIPIAGLLAALVTGRHPGLAGSIYIGIWSGLVWYLLSVLLRLPADSESHVSLVAAGVSLGGVLAFWGLLELLAREIEGPTVPLALSLSLGAAAQTFLVFGSASLGQLAGTCAMALGVYAAIGGLMHLPALPRPAIVGVCAIAAGVGLDAWFFSIEPLPALPLLLIIGAPLLTALALLPRVAEMRPLPRVAMLLALVVVPLVIAVGMVIDSAPPDDPYSSFGK